MFYKFQSIADFFMYAWFLFKPELISFFCAGIITGFFIWALRPIAHKINLVDKPNDRKHHIGEVPLIGGVAIYLGFMFALLILNIPLGEYRSFIACVSFLMIVGVLDDMHELAPKRKFIAQLVAICLMIFWGKVYLMEVGSILGGERVYLGYFAWPVTFLGVIAVVNAVNMSDGLDGLASGYILIALVSLEILTIASPHINAAKVLLLIVICVSVFFFFNIKLSGRGGASVFMGDAGSMVLGFVLAWFLIQLSQGDTRAIKPVTALWIIAVPLFDLTGVSLRRFIKRRKIYLADREHFHHIFLVAGYSSSTTVLILLGISTLMATIGMLAQYYSVADYIMFFLFLFLFLLYFSGMNRAWRIVKFISKK